MFDEMLFDSDSGECNDTIRGCFFLLQRSSEETDIDDLVASHRSINVSSRGNLLSTIAVSVHNSTLVHNSFHFVFALVHSMWKKMSE